MAAMNDSGFSDDSRHYNDDHITLLLNDVTNQHHHSTIEVVWVTEQVSQW